MRERTAIAVPGRPAPLVIGSGSSISALGRALRPKQWAKNALVFAAPGAAGVLGRPSVLAHATLAFAGFCAVASAAYLVNDVVDAPQDRSHAAKRFRPVASRELSPRLAVAAASVLILAGGAIGSYVGVRFLSVEFAYVAMTLTYSLWLKRIAVIELVAVASGFVLRAVAGSAATGVPPSAWFLILACSGAMCVVAGKRLADTRRAEDDSERSARARYPVEYLRGVWVVAAGVALTAYCLWAFAVPHVVDGVAWSQVSIVPFAVAILRYAYAIEMGDGGTPEAVFLRDRTLQVVALAWLVVYALGVYLK
ncbi:MAG: decaprenyl-phosphate phosphoribosyltransferase [Actinobacteria bacterium]|nr:decaprenyl-phosphate phosphoribosyltransferase [Actinomycetota bacterium]